MALTVRTNGSGSNNLINASWFNDFVDLLTGNMTDQIVTLRTSANIRAIAGPPGAATLALATGTNLGIGTYLYKITFVDANGGETVGGAFASITTTSGNQKVSLSLIPVGGAGTTKRNIYRTAVGGSSYFLLATLNDNTTTTYSDTTADASLSTTAIPAHPSFGGLFIRDYTNAVKAQIYNDGAISFDAGNITSDGAGTLIASSFVGGLKDNAAAACAIAAHDTGTTMQFKPTGTGRGLLFSSRDSGGVLHNGLTIDTSGNTQVAGSLSSDAGTITTDGSGHLSAVTLKEGTVRVAVQGSHSAGQPIISYGTGAPASLAANEIYIQIA